MLGFRKDFISMDLLALRSALVYLIRTRGLQAAQVCRDFNVSQKTAYKWLKRYQNNPDKPLMDLSRRPCNSPNITSYETEQLILSLQEKHRWGARKIRRHVVHQNRKQISLSAIQTILKRNGRLLKKEKKAPSLDGLVFNLLNSIIYPKQDSLQKITEILMKGKKREKKKAAAIFLLCHGIPEKTIAKGLRFSVISLKKYWREFNERGIETILNTSKSRLRKCDDQEIRNALFAVLHSPPSSHGINRPAWRLKDLNDVLRRKGAPISLDIIRKIIRSAWYRWQKAKKVLTSKDPEYGKKLEGIKQILSNLGTEDRFFSIDEFGPFAVKMQGGRKLVGPNERPTIPQYQKSKGKILITGALELSHNQMTHFFSEKKDTKEMIKLLNILLEKYRGCDRLYFSWDAASWHASKALQEKVKTINLPDYREAGLTPFVELVRLPKSAQFLNVIESVFSGMARAIIHNSDYQSVEEAVTAIDRYFRERNEHFLNHPKRAGKKIWGNEPSSSEFTEWNNCKDSRWR